MGKIYSNLLESLIAVNFTFLLLIVSLREKKLSSSMNDVGRLFSRLEANKELHCKNGLDIQSKNVSLRKHVLLCALVSVICLYYNYRCNRVTEREGAPLPPLRATRPVDGGVKGSTAHKLCT